MGRFRSVCRAESADSTPRPWPAQTGRDSGAGTAVGGIPSRLPRASGSAREHNRARRRHRLPPSPVTGRGPPSGSSPIWLASPPRSKRPATRLLAEDGAGDGAAQTLLWRDVRRVREVAAAAALTLLATGHDERLGAALNRTDVAHEGMGTRHSGHVHTVEPAARSFLHAQRLVVAGNEPLLSSPMGEVVPATVRRLSAVALTQLEDPDGTVGDTALASEPSHAPRTWSDGSPAAARSGTGRPAASRIWRAPLPPRIAGMDSDWSRRSLSLASSMRGGVLPGSTPGLRGVRSRGSGEHLPDSALHRASRRSDNRIVVARLDSPLRGMGPVGPLPGS